jgi:hypothetical protein
MTDDATQAITLPAVKGRPVVHDRNLFERVLRAVREVLTIVVLALVAFILILSLAAVKAIGDRLGGSDLGGVGPAPTAPADNTCPFGPGQCGD